MFGPLRSQQAKAIGLTLLIVMLAQTAYSNGMLGWSYPERFNDQSDSMGSNACNTATLDSNDPIHVDRINGSDVWAGTAACPKASIASAVGNASAGDEIIVHAGIYHENITIDNKDNLLLRAASDERVVMDGTRSISDDFDLTWDIADGSGIQEVALPQSGWQLFLNRTEQVPARWPNAAFSNNTVFNRTYWAEGTLTNSNNAYTLGWLQDAGPESGIHDGLNETINATGLDPVGAIAILNVGSFRSFSREITSWNPSNGTFGYDGTGMSWKTKHHAYFLEGKRELIDVDGEWWLNSTNNRLHYRPPSGQDANDLDLRVKVQPFAITVQNSDGVSIEGIDFFGTTIKVDQCDECTFANSTLEYPSTSRRSQGIAGESADERFVTYFYRCTNTLVDAVSITNTDGAAIEFHGAAGQSNGNIVNNSYFHAIDWSASDQKGLMTTIYEGGRDMTFSNNTVHLTGASSVLSIGDSPTVLYNEVWDVGHLQTDGAVVQLMQGEVQGSEIAYNWIHDISKYGIRFDAPINQISTGNNGSIHHNVIWNASGGIMAKGDYHDISNNTVFGERVDGKNNIIILHEQNTGNENSTTWNNAVDAIAAHRSNTIWDYPLEDNTHGMNWNGYIHQYANSLSVFDTHTCAILENKSLACWGNNGNGQLGLGNTNSQSTPQYVDVGTGRTIKSIASSGSNSGHTCAILDNGSVMCWGANGNGQLGLGNTSTQESSPQYVDIGAGRTAIQLTIGNTHTCALLDNKSVSCWGSNAFRQLGIDSSIAYSSIPMHVNITAIEIHSAHLHTCAKLDNGSVMCWGYNNYGQMGLSNNTNTIDPPILIPLDSDREVTSIGIGKHHSCFTYDNGSLVCSGRNNVGQLGLGYTNPHINELSYVSQLLNQSLQSSLGSYQSCVLLINGSAQCSGANTWGQLGDGTTTPKSSLVSTLLPSGRRAVFVSMGHGHTCARLDNQSTACWGNNYHGQLGLGNNTDQSTPVIIPLLGNLATITVKDMLVDPDNDDFRPKWGSHLHRLDAGAYDADDSNPWTAGIGWTYTRSSNYTTGCMDSIALNYNPNAGFDDGSCRYLEADLGERVAILNKAIEPITFTESLSNFDFGTWSTGVSNGTTAFSQSWRKPTGPGTDANYDFQDFAIAENGDQAIVFTQNHSGGSTPHSLALMYKPFNGSWSSSIIDNSTNTGFKPSIAIDRTGALHIAYIDNANDTIRYATNVSGSWAFSTLGDAEWTDSHSRKTDIAIHPITDAVYIVHTMKDVGDSGSALAGARFHTNEGGSWVNESITDRGLKSGYDPQIALDSDGNIHVSYYLDQGSDLKIASRIDGVWQNETVYGINGINSGNTPAIAIDSQDVIHIVHMINYASNNKRLTLTSGTLGSWSNTTFGSSTLYRHSYNPSIAIDSNDAIHIAYHYGTTSKHLHYISNMTGSWSLETLDSSNAGWGARVSIDNNDDIHIAHSDLTGSGTIAHYLEMTKRTGSGEGLTAHPIFDISPPLPEGLSMNWRNGTITGTPTTVQDSTTYTVWANISERSASTSISISVDWSLRPSVSGVSATLNTAITPITFEWNTTIWESRVTNGSDHPSSATNSNYAGKATDIAADSNGNTHVVSFDDNNDDLRYTTNAGGTWTSSLIHESGNTGRHPSIVIDSNDMIHVVFVRQTGTSLMYMNKSVSATSWSSPTTISSDAWNKATGLALDEDDNLYVSWARKDANYKRQCFVKTKPASSSTWSDLPGLYTHYQSENHQVRTACDVAVDSNKKVHIVAHDASSSSNSGDLRYTTNVSGSWVSSDIRGYSTSSADTGRLVNLVIDSNDKIHMTYIETYGTAKAYHESNVGGSWSRSELSWYADFPAIAIDSNDDLHIALGSSGTIELHQRAASSTGSFSSSTQTTCTGGCDEYISIIADNNDDLHLAFSRHLNHKLGVSYEQGTGKGVKNDPGSWRPVISSISSCEVSPSLPQGLSVNNQRCTLSGTPTEVASNQTYTVWANTSSGDSYSTQVWLRVVQSPPTISYNSNNFILVNNTAMSPSAIPTNSGGPIPSRIIDVGSVGSYTSWGISNDTSIAMDSDGYMHISYRDSTNKTLLYATDKSGSWVTTTVDSEYGSGDASSIALDSNNNVHIVHFESDDWRLRYTTNMSGSWVSSRIVATGFLGFSPSIALDSDDNIHVSYMQADSAYRIKYATNSSGSWVDTTVSPTTTDCSLVSPNICHLAPNAFRTTTSIALDSNDKPHISYTCAGTVSNADLCFTTNAGGSWSYQTLDSSGNTGFDNSLSIDSDNNLHISYYDATNENLRYATNKSGSWDYSSIDQTGDVGHDTSLRIDSDNNVHISYYDKTNRDLKYATNSSGVWVNSTIDSNLDVGTGSSIFVESNDRVHISYQESVSDTDGNLRYITVDNNNFIYGWSINSTLPDGLHFNENTGVISGTPTQLMSSTQYTIQARNSGGASTATINISVSDVAPGPFEYIPENNTVTNNSLVHIAPSFVNLTTGSGTTWQKGTSTNPGSNFAFNINGVVYFDAGSNEKLWAYSPANNSTWKVIDSVTWVGEHMAHVVDDTIYFSGHTGTTGREFYAYNTTNNTMWLVSDIRSGGQNSNPGQGASAQDGHVLFFKANDGNGVRWYTYNHSNGTLTRLGKFFIGGGGSTLTEAIGDTLYISGRESNSDHNEVWAYSAVNATAWIVEDIYSGSQHFGTEAGYYLDTVVNGILLFDAWNGVSSDPRSIWAYNPANATAWELQSADSLLGDSHVSTSSTSCGQPLVVDDVAYFCATGGSDAGGYELWAYNTSNETTWLVTDIQQPGDSHPGQHMFEVLGDTLYFSANDGSTGNELWAYDTSNHSTWRVADINSGNFHSNPGQYMTVIVGDTLYFSAKTEATNQELFAYDTSNQSLWLVEDLIFGSESSFVGQSMALVAGNKLIFDARNSILDSSSYLFGHEPSEINRMTNTGGAVTSWAINTTNLPTGLTFSTTNGTIYGTPTELWTHTSYMVWANNSGGSSLAYLNITVVDEVPTLSYSPSTLEFTNNTAHVAVPLDATLTGSGTIISWAINGTLPNGINFGTSNGTIWGTPTELWNSTIYTVWANNSGGSASTTITISVVDQLPGLNISPENTTATNNTAITTIVITTVGPGEIDTWELEGTLPNGLTWTSANQTIWGTPTELIITTQYTVWANNTGGSVSATLNITINDQLPTLSYTPENLTLTKGQSSSDLPLNAAVTGGAVTSWAISPALPSGLTFGTSNGTIWGTPTSLMTLKTFTIWANNSGGSSSATVNITVNDELPNISYSPDWFVLTNNTAMSPTATPTNSGGAVPSTVIDSIGNVGEYSSMAIDSYGFKHISYFDNTNDDLKYATDKTGSWVTISVDTTGNVGAYTSIAIDSNDAVHISYYASSGDDLKYATCSSGCTTASNWNKVSVDTTGGVGAFTSIAIDSNDAVHISYYDATNDDLKYATCSSGCTSASNWDDVSVDTTGNVGAYTSIAIDSNDALHISYFDGTNQDLKYTTCSSGCTTASNWNKVSVDTTGGVGYYTSIAIDSNDAVHISYYDTTNVHLKYATCSSGCTSASNWDDVSVDTTSGVGYYPSIAIDSNDAVHISYFDESNDDLKYATCSSGCTTASNWDNVSVDTTGDVGRYSSIAIDSNDAVHISYEDATNDDLKYIVLDSSSNIYGYSVSPDLPAGLSLNAFTGEISGTPTELSTNTTYTITVRNSGGTNTTTITIEVLDQLPGLSISPENTTATNNTAITTIVITTVGPGEIDTWELEGTLPTGLTWTSANQTIWGTPTELMTTTQYTVWANNTGGSVSGTLNITVNDQLPISLTITPENTTATNNTEITTIAITTVGPGEIDTWELEGELPDGLTWTSANQTIWGTPIELMTTTQYTIWANNTGGSVFGTLNITVNDQVPGLNISPENMTATNNTEITTIAITTVGPGEIVTWELEGELPDGLTWTSANQTIWGTPTELMTTTQYTVWANNTGGSVSATLNITVNDEVPELHISPENTTATNNTAITTIVITTAGSGEIDTWELEGELPDGLTWTSANQTIWGTPTELMTTTEYTVWANNTGGEVSATLNITVNDQVPGLNISPENTTATNNTEITTIAITTAGSGEIDTWELEGTLPNGLTWTPANQTIWGTPTELMTTTQYTVWANNTGGDVSATLNITVNDQVPGLNISPENTTATNNTAIITIAITTVGSGEIVTWELEGELPDGLTWTSANQTIWGTPTELMTTTSYTIWANNTGGSVSAMLNITVIDEVPTTLSYSNPDILLTNNTAMTPHDPITTGPGTVVTWDIVGELPEGIMFNSTTGILSGTPTELMTTTQYTIWANNTGGSISTVINITVVDQLPSLTYPLISLDLVVNTINSDIPFEPALSGPGEIISWEMVGQLPSGMQFNTSTGILSGIPTELWSTANYTIWANNTGGSNDFSFSLTVVDQVPNEIGYSDVNLTLTNNTAMSPEQPLITGPGTITSWVIIGELPDGIYFSQSTGEISGTPTELWPLTPYTVWANNSGGSVFFEFNLSVIAIEPSISYNSNALTLTVGVSMTPLESLSTGGVIASWEAYPELPDGISIDSLTGYISGTPTTLQSPQSYTIWANNSGGITTFELSISIIDIPASIDISPTSIVLTIGESMNPAQISASGGQVIEWGIHPELPNGLLFDTTNLSITGTPSELIPETLYTIWANNSGGSQTTSISITVIDIPPTIEYVDEHVFYSNVSEVLIEPIVSGGAILNYSIDSDLVNGLSFDYANGSIVGIPSETLSRTQFTITVSNSGGTAVATLNITILSSVGCMDPLAENYDSVATLDSGLCIYTDSDGDGVADINEIQGCTDLDAVNYMTTATDDDGSCIGRLSVIYPEYSIVLIVGQNNVSIIPEVLGQTVEIWSIEPSLPEPLEFNYLVENGVLTVGKGSISGIPLQPLNLSNYTIIAIDEDTNQSLSIRIYLQILEDTDGDGKPNVGSANWIEDLDDDDDGYVDSIEEECGSDPENAASTPDLDSEGKCVQEQVSDTEEPPIPETTANLYYWCILPLAIILAVMFFSLFSRQRHNEEENKESELDEYNQPLELT